MYSMMTQGFLKKEHLITQSSDGSGYSLKQIFPVIIACMHVSIASCNS